MSNASLETCLVGLVSLALATVLLHIISVLRLMSVLLDHTPGVSMPCALPARLVRLLSALLDYTPGVSMPCALPSQLPGLCPDLDHTPCVSMPCALPSRLSGLCPDW